MIKKFNDMIKEREVFDDIDQPFDDTPFREVPGANEPYVFQQDEDDLSEIEDIEFEDVESENDEIESLLSTLRKIVRNSGFKKSYVFFDQDEECIVVQFILNKTEKMNNVMNVMNFLKKLESDILIQYESEFDLWETKSGDPLLSAKFYYDEHVSSKGEEDYVPDHQKEFGKEKRGEIVFDAESDLGTKGDYANSSTKERLNKIGKYEFDEDPPF